MSPCGRTLLHLMQVQGAVSRSAALTLPLRCSGGIVQRYRAEIGGMVRHQCSRLS